jgi:hypothetical protein
MLVVLDNAEHLREALAPWLAGLPSRLPRLRWLVTSREPLQLPQKQLFRPAPLDVPPPEADEDLARLCASSAVELFVERVAARLPGFAPMPAQQHALAEIKAAGQRRSPTQLPCMHPAMRAAADDVTGTRGALVDALPTLGTMQAAEVRLLALA